ncbi:MAG: hypothetical protein LQ342_003097 [Letrouitia transgressa]|nr:MAG: hypothetical protein LQ342_003097 [Letrouitia transgressa]
MSRSDQDNNEQEITSTEESRPPSRILQQDDMIEDNELNERPVREKLKETTIASIPDNNIPASATDSSQGEDLQNLPEANNNQATEQAADLPGRVMRKRAFDDLQEPADSTHESRPNIDRDDSGWVRDTSQSGKGGKGFASGARGLHFANNGSEDANEGAETLGLKGNVEPAQAQLEESRGSAFSPPMKRSRENYDVEIWREQKIAATDEAKAYRGSDEIERDISLPENDDPPDANSGHSKFEDSILKESTGLMEPTDYTSATSKSKTTTESPLTGDPPSQIKLPTFDKTAFGVMSGSSASPFATSRPFSVSPFSANSGFSSFGSPEKTLGPNNSHFAAQKGSEPSSNPSAPAPAGASPSSGLGAFGSSKIGGFGSAFSNGFGKTVGNAPKLQSFAAPVGDAKLGGTTEPVKTLGASAEESDDDASASDNEEERDVSKEGKDGETDGRFQQQDVGTGEDGENTIFVAPRTQLYLWNGEGWRERGKGTFKLNVTDLHLEERESPPKGRFIMRAHQTFRVLLNQPVFDQMQVGNSKGQEPQGKNFSFAVIDDGRPVPYLLKMGDENESKTLYREVRELQRRLKNHS